MIARKTFWHVSFYLYWLSSLANAPERCNRSRTVPVPDRAEASCGRRMGRSGRAGRHTPCHSMCEPSTPMRRAPPMATLSHRQKGQAAPARVRAGNRSASAVVAMPCHFAFANGLHWPSLNFWYMAARLASSVLVSSSLKSRLRSNCPTYSCSYSSQSSQSSS